MMILRLTDTQVKSVVDATIKSMKIYAEEMDRMDDARNEEGFIPLTPEIMWYNDNMTEEDIFDVLSKVEHQHFLLHIQ